jgi:hypothetical protein
MDTFFIIKHCLRQFKSIAKVYFFSLFQKKFSIITLQKHIFYNLYKIFPYLCSQFFAYIIKVSTNVDLMLFMGYNFFVFYNEYNNE